MGGVIYEIVDGSELVRFAHNLSRASRSCDWNNGMMGLKKPVFHHSMRLTKRMAAIISVILSEA
jgi:hypothetical protein